MLFPKGAQNTEAGTPTCFLSQSATLLNSGCMIPLLQAGFQPGCNFFVSFLIAVELIESVKAFLRWEGRTYWTSTDQFSHAYPHSQEKWKMLIACACISKESGGTASPVHPRGSNCRQVRALVHVQTSPDTVRKPDTGALRYPKYRAPFVCTLVCGLRFH